MILADTLFDPYRDDPRFHELLETLDWTEEYKKGRADIEKAKLGDGRWKELTGNFPVLKDHLSD